jgi:hypothetical protein
MNVKEQFISACTFKPQDGNQIGFWKDKWLGANAQEYQYLNPYYIVRKRSVTVVERGV